MQSIDVGLRNVKPDVKATYWGVLKVTKFEDRRRGRFRIWLRRPAFAHDLRREDEDEDEDEDGALTV
jgi:hypothetical protein